MPTNRRRRISKEGRRKLTGTFQIGKAFPLLAIVFFFSIPRRDWDFSNFKRKGNSDVSIKPLGNLGSSNIWKFFGFFLWGGGGVRSLIKKICRIVGGVTTSPIFCIIVVYKDSIIE